MAKPELAVALTVNGARPSALPSSAAKLIVCATLLMTTVALTCGAAL
jgi:hypothetical protein